MDDLLDDEEYINLIFRKYADLPEDLGRGNMFTYRKEIEERLPLVKKYMLTAEEDVRNYIDKLRKVEIEKLKTYTHDDIIELLLETETFPDREFLERFKNKYREYLLRPDYDCKNPDIDNKQNAIYAAFTLSSIKRFWNK